MVASALFFAAIVPFIVLFCCLLLLRRSVAVSAFAAVAVLSAVLVGVWGVEPAVLAAASIKAMLVLFEITLILFGALVSMALLRRSGALAVLQRQLIAVSADRRAQAILIAFFFVGLFEGLAGFGVPGVLAAPLLVAIGFGVLPAIVLALVGNVATVPFGALGTPLLIGWAQGAAAHSVGSPVSAELAGQLLGAVTAATALASVALVMWVPLWLSCLLTHMSSGVVGGKKVATSWRAGFGIWQHALVAGGSFAVMFAAVAVVFGAEFPSVFASLFAGSVFVWSLRRFPIAPEKQWQFVGDAQGVQKNKTATRSQLLKAALPLGVTSVGLLVSRITWLPVGSFLQNNAVLRVDSLAGIGIDHLFAPLYSPGVFLLLGAATAAVAYRLSPGGVVRELGGITAQLLRAAITLGFVLIFVQLLLYSGSGALGVSIPLFLAQYGAQLPIGWLGIAPFVGWFGSLLTGSLTVSTLLFAQLQLQAAVASSVQPVLVGVAHMLGGSAGNMVSLHNIVVLRTAVVGEVGPTRIVPSEARILLLLLPLALAYVLAIVGVVHILAYVVF